MCGVLGVVADRPGVKRDRVDSGLNYNDVQRYRPWLSVGAIGRRQTVEETGQGGMGKRMLERRCQLSVLLTGD